jgi:REP element-mobilizing transposase RayT
MVHGLLTWPAYGTWLPGPARGWVDPGSVLRDEPLPEPDHVESIRRRGGLKWPPVTLDAPQRTALIEEMPRIAELRSFDAQAMAVAEDHVHLLLQTQREDIPRLVQLTKGALSRRLTVLAGDHPASGASGEELRHHKWWARQYSCRVSGDASVIEGIRRRLEAHPPPMSFWNSR